MIVLADSLSQKEKKKKKIVLIEEHIDTQYVTKEKKFEMQTWVLLEFEIKFLNVNLVEEREVADNNHQPRLPLCLV